MFPAVFVALSLAAPPDADLKKRAADLVARLGSPSYHDREEAARALLAIGFPAKDAVLAGQKSTDSEISDRCQKLYPAIWRADLDRRIEQFLDRPDEAAPADLPGAARWLKIAGDGKPSRGLYATMVRAHPELLLDIELHPERRYNAYLDFVRNSYVRTAGRPTPADADVLLFLFLGAWGDVRPARQPGLSTAYLYPFLNSTYLSARLAADPPDVPVRKLFAGWLEKERYSLALRRGIDVAAQHKVRECVPTLLTIATDPGTLVSMRSTALLGLAKLGTRDDLPALAPFLKDELQIAATNVNGEPATVQVRDVALGIAIQLAGQDPAEFGFRRRPQAGPVSLSYIYYAFADDEKRAAAHAKWREWAEKNLKK